MGAGESSVDFSKALDVFSSGTREMVVVGAGGDTASRQLLGCRTWVTAPESAATTMVISAGASPRISPPVPDLSSKLSRLVSPLRLRPVKDCVGSGGGTPEGIAHVCAVKPSGPEEKATFRSLCERPENLLVEETKSLKTARCGVGRTVFLGSKNPSARPSNALVHV